jgi:hypothetical protein
MQVRIVQRGAGVTGIRHGIIRLIVSLETFAKSVVTSRIHWLSAPIIGHISLGIIAPVVYGPWATPSGPVTIKQFAKNFQSSIRNMGKGAKRSSQGSTSINGGNGGILGSGIFGHVGTSTNIICQANDSSFYCRFMKFVNVFFMLLTFAIIAYLIYFFVTGKGTLTGGSLMKTAYDSMRKNRV